MLFSVVYCDAS